MSLEGEWKDATITIATDDDLTPEVDLGRVYNFLNIYAPTLTSTTITIEVSEKSGGTFEPLYSATGVTKAASTGGWYDTFQLGGYRWIKILTGTGQAANRTFRVQGWKY